MNDGGPSPKTPAEHGMFVALALCAGSGIAAILLSRLRDKKKERER